MIGPLLYKCSSFLHRGPPPMMTGAPGGPPYAGLPRGVSGALVPHNGTMGSSPPSALTTAPPALSSGGQPNSNIQQNLAQLAETIAQATSLIQAAGLNQGRLQDLVSPLS